MSDADPGTTFENYDNDGFCGLSSTMALAASLDHSDFLTEQLGESTRLFEQDGFWIFENRPDFSDVDDILGDGGDLLPAGEFQELVESMQVRYVLDLPGVAVDGQTNATSIESNGRFVWDVDPLNPPNRFFAQTQPGSDGGSLGLILIIVAAVLALAALAWFLMNRNKSGSASPTTPGTPGATTPGTPPGVGHMPTPSQPAEPARPVVPEPGPSASTPVTPADPSARETVAMTPQQAEQAAAELAAARAAEQGADSAASAPAPTYDEALGTWVIDDPQRGRLIHDPETDSWRPA